MQINDWSHSPDTADMISDSKGFSIATVLVAVAILASLLLGLMTTFQGMFKGSKRLTARVDKDQIRMYISSMTKCQDTLPSGTCTPGTLMQVKNGTTLVVDNNVSSPTKYGDWSLKAECAPSGDMVLVRATLLKSTGNLNSTNQNDFNRNPATNSEVTWNDTKSLVFPIGVGMCKTGNLETRVTALEALVAQQQVILNSHSATLANHDNSINAHSATLASHNHDIQQHSGTLVNHDARIANLEASALTSLFTGDLYQNGPNERDEFVAIPFRPSAAHISIRQEVVGGGGSPTSCTAWVSSIQANGVTFHIKADGFRSCQYIYFVIGRN